MTVEEIMEIFKPWIYNDENQAGTQLEVIDASDLPMIADRIVKNCNIADVSNRRELLTAFLQYGKQRHYTPLTEEQIEALVNDFEGSL